MYSKGAPEIAFSLSFSHSVFGISKTNMALCEAYCSIVKVKCWTSHCKNGELNQHCIEFKFVSSMQLFLEKGMASKTSHNPKISSTWPTNLL